MNICLICLRTDRKLKLASHTLEEFHDELCDFSVITMMPSIYYCCECEYLLRKFHRFKEKCMEALKVLKKWMPRHNNKKPIHLLYTLVPQSNLGMWKHNPQKIGNYTFESTDVQLQPELYIVVEPLKDSKDVKIEYDDGQWISTDKISTSVNIFKTENNSGKDAESHSDQSENELKTDEPTAATTTKRKINARPRKTEEPNTTTVKRKTNAKKAEEPTATTTKRKTIDRETEKHVLLKTLDNLLNEDSDSTDTDDVKLQSIDEKVSAILKPKPTRKKALTKKDLHDQVRETDKRHESMFDIEYLSTKEMQIEEFQRRKTYECYVKAEHKCEICYQVFKSAKFLKYHVTNWHTESPDKVCCPICKIWSQSRSHPLTHGAVFKCKLCPLVTYHRETMHNHYEWHKGKQYRCEQCDTILKSKSAYRTHLGKVHRRGGNVCECCGRGFNTAAGLRIHKNNSRRCAGRQGGWPEGGERVRCDECDVTFPTQKVFTSHVADVHSPSQPRAGARRQLDSAGLPRPTGMREPRSRKGKCVKPGRHTCQLCNVAGGSYGWLQLHFKREHPNDDLNLLYADKRKHLCDICGIGFCNVYALRDHMNVHTGARPHACDLCAKTFRSMPLMRNHRLRHFPSGYQCAHCGKRFKTSSNLYNHAKAHTGEKNYDCEICGKAFLHRNSLNEHIRGVHYNIRRVKRGGEAGGREVKRRKIFAEERDSDFDDSRD